jgi:hypothetical protein
MERDSEETGARADAIKGSAEAVTAPSSRASA